MKIVLLLISLIMLIGSVSFIFEKSNSIKQEWLKVTIMASTIFIGVYAMGCIIFSIIQQHLL